MAYEKRFDGRKWDELRPVEAKVISAEVVIIAPCIT